MHPDEVKRAVGKGLLAFPVTHFGADGAVVSSEQILESAWDDATDPFSNAVRMTVSRLRSKLGNPPVIETVSAAGYRVGGLQ